MLAEQQKFVQEKIWNVKKGCNKREVVSETVWVCPESPHNRNCAREMTYGTCIRLLIYRCMLNYLTYNVKWQSLRVAERLKWRLGNLWNMWWVNEVRLAYCVFLFSRIAECFCLNNKTALWTLLTFYFQVQLLFFWYERCNFVVKRMWIFSLYICSFTKTFFVCCALLFFCLFLWASSLLNICLCKIFSCCFFSKIVLLLIFDIVRNTLSSENSCLGTNGDYLKLLDELTKKEVSASATRPQSRSSKAARCRLPSYHLCIEYFYCDYLVYLLVAFQLLSFIQIISKVIFRMHWEEWVRRS